VTRFEVDLSKKSIECPLKFLNVAKGRIIKSTKRNEKESGKRELRIE
jgi:hypothetical protein